MAWPSWRDFNDAVQDPRTCFADEELWGEVTTDAMGLPKVCSGNFAVVYQLRSADQRRQWAVKCFTKPVPDRDQRYREISAHLERANLPFSVAFAYQEKGIRVRGAWYPLVKMDWVEGLTLTQFVRANLERPALLDLLCQIWLKLAQRLRAADVTHGDLQHGNVLLVPGSSERKLAVKLVDYDGLWVPALAQQPSGELGLRDYQHPQRMRDKLYGPEVDRFPHLVIYTALRALKRHGKALWERFDTGENLLFSSRDFANPGDSALLAELWNGGDVDLRQLAGRLVLAAAGRLQDCPELNEVVADDAAKALTLPERVQVEKIIKPRPGVETERPNIEQAPLNFADEPVAARTPAPNLAVRRQQVEVTDDKPELRTESAAPLLQRPVVRWALAGGGVLAAVVLVAVIAGSSGTPAPVAQNGNPPVPAVVSPEELDKGGPRPHVEPLPAAAPDAVAKAFHEEADRTVIGLARQAQAAVQTMASDKGKLLEIQAAYGDMMREAGALVAAARKLEAPPGPDGQEYHAAFLALLDAKEATLKQDVKAMADLWIVNGDDLRLRLTALDRQIKQREDEALGRLRTAQQAFLKARPELVFPPPLGQVPLTIPLPVEVASVPLPPVVVEPPPKKVEPVPQPNMDERAERITLASGTYTGRYAFAPNDPLDPIRRLPFKSFLVPLEGGKLYFIDEQRTRLGGFDPALRVEDLAGKSLAEDANARGDAVARVRFTPSSTGPYRVVASAFRGGFEEFGLAIQEQRIHRAGATLNEHLAATDRSWSVGGFHRYYKEYVVEMEAGANYLFTQTSKWFDPNFRLYDMQDRLLGTSVIRGPSTRILYYQCKASGNYLLQASSFVKEKTGPFVLTLARTNSPVVAAKDPGPKPAVNKGPVALIIEPGTTSVSNVGTLASAQDMAVYSLLLTAGQKYTFTVKGGFTPRLRLFADPGLTKALTAETTGEGGACSMQYRSKTGVRVHLQVAADNDGLGAFQVTIKREAK